MKLRRFALAALLIEVLVLAVALGVALAQTGNTLTTGAVTCGTSAAEAMAANSKRRGAVFTNSASNTDSIYMGKDSTVTTANGIPLSVGQSMNDETYVGAWWCISGTAGQNLRKGEVTR